MTVTEGLKQAAGARALHGGVPPESLPQEFMLEEAEQDADAAAAEEADAEGTQQGGI